MRKAWKNNLAALLACLPTCLPAGASAQPAFTAGAAAQHQPAICTGFTPPDQWSSDFGHPSTPDCPRGFAVFSVLRQRFWSGGTPDKTAMRGQCCPLPAPDLLVWGDRKDDKTSCPENYVVIGGHSPDCTDCVKTLHCARINETRYQLGPERPGIYWGFGGTHWHSERTYGRHDVPAGLRYSLGRRTIDHWEENGCVGDPLGSLLVRKQTHRCEGFFFRELQYRGLPGDPPAGTPVKMFRDCDNLSSVYDQEPQCIEFPR